MNVTEIRDSDFKNAFPGIFNFTVGILIGSIKLHRSNQKSEIPVTTDRLEKLVNFECDKRVDDTTRSRFTSRTTFSTTASVNDQAGVSFLEKSRFELDEYRYQIEMLLEKWDKEKSAQGLNLHLATQQFSLEIANKGNIAQ